MKITILNGNPNPSPFDTYLQEVQTVLQKNGQEVTLMNLRELPLKYCVGCWDCWVKTPGRCQNDEASQEMDQAVIQSDFVLWAAPIKMGYPSELLKMALDKHVPLVHPYVVADQGETHHRKRYESYPRVGLLVENEPATDESDLRIISQLFQRTALNFKTRLYFCCTNQTAVVDLVNKILDPQAEPLPLPKTPQPTLGLSVPPPPNITLFNGSPRGARGNSAIFLDQFSQCFNENRRIYHLVNVNSTPEHVHAFEQAKMVWLAFPLYTDAMPGIVKHFIEALEPLAGKFNNPPLGFIVQSGFPEGLHSRYIEQYLEKFAKRMGSPYLGTIVKGNGEGVRLMPDEMNRKLFANLQSLGKDVIEGKPMNASTLSAIARPERFPSILEPIYRLFLNLPIANAYFDQMLKKNRVYKDRFNQPFMNL